MANSKVGVKEIWQMSMWAVSQELVAFQRWRWSFSIFARNDSTMDDLMTGNILSGGGTILHMCLCRLPIPFANRLVLHLGVGAFKGLFEFSALLPLSTRTSLRIAYVWR